MPQYPVREQCGFCRAWGPGWWNNKELRMTMETILMLVSQQLGIVESMDGYESRDQDSDGKLFGLLTPSGINVQ